MPPALKALLAQLLGCTAAFAAARSGVLPAGLWPLVAVQAAAATGAAVALKSAHWWRWIHLGFLPLVVGALQLGIPPGWYLAAFLVFALIYWSSFRTQVPLFLSNRLTAETVAGLLPAERPAKLLDLGSGTGSLLRPLARMRPDCRFEGMESAPAPYALSCLLSRAQPNISLARGDFWLIPWSDYDVVYAFLSPVPMSRVWSKASAELRPGSLLVSNSFPVEGVEPESVVEVGDRRHTRLYCYLPAGPAPVLKTGIAVP
ncbi:class I SAM-dependent methyltransferase [Zoogloea sp.]|uniref:class I SAM-dependent methyltransferase n=1 Tax=Zoogloea sp. TaxID=49181 RepID=UPI001B436DC3|nr:class I SAM-dependent methyltransferase [Zoogloea sp.]MBP8132955.1 class I SAM-dependent methyltransferase [Zoogloea sp.]MDD2668855.1 class I SAM-dependent methyltransferase [Zoogloea sp.]